VVIAGGGAAQLALAALCERGRPRDDRTWADTASAIEAHVVEVMTARTISLRTADPERKAKDMGDDARRRQYVYRGAIRLSWMRMRYARGRQVSRRSARFSRRTRRNKRGCWNAGTDRV
jgi:hypothetical protein